MKRLVACALVLCGTLGGVRVARAIEGYADELVYEPGDTVLLHVSSLGAYRIEVVRFGAFEDPFDRPDPIMVVGGAAPSVQQTDFGSFVETPVHQLPTEALSVEAWIYPNVDSGDYQAIISQAHAPSEQAMSLLLVSGTRQLLFYLSNSATSCSGCVQYSTNAIPLGTWTHVVATYDGSYKRIYVNGALDSEMAYSAGVAVVDEPVRIGAAAIEGKSVNHFNGKLDCVALYDVALSAEQVAARRAAGLASAKPAPLPGALFQYDFQEGYGTSVIDSTSNGRTALLPSGGARGVSGPGGLGPAIRFAQDDFVDASWAVTDTFEVGSDWPSGLYAARLIENDTGAEAHAVFVVRPRSPEAPIAVVAATNTWVAYNQWPGIFGAVGIGLYSVHYDRSPGYFAPVRRPNPSADPYALFGPSVGYAQEVLAERFLHSWLEHEGRAYDLYSDLDLHEGRIPLSRYRVLVFAGHNEYWTAEMRDHVAAYVRSGGNVLSMSGNTMYWKTTFDPSRSVIEVRKWEGQTAQGQAPPDERVHSQTGERGGLWGILLREGQYDDYDLFGTVTEAFLDWNYGGSYRVIMPEHWAFAGLGLEVGSRLGAVSRNGLSAVGHEVDATHPVLSPPDVQVLARGTDVVGQHLDLRLDDTIVYTATNEAGEITSWDTPEGGSVFTVGSICATGSLGVDPLYSRMTCNVLSRFTSQEEEICDGIDNDCDGEKDDDATCDDGDACTNDRGDCAKGTCAHEPIPNCEEDSGNALDSSAVRDGGGKLDSGVTPTKDNDGGCSCSAPGQRRTRESPQPISGFLVLLLVTGVALRRAIRA